MSLPIYRFENCHLVRVIDGDTFVASIDVGFGFTTTQRIRLMGCDMPERNQPGGSAATAQLSGYLGCAERLIITTIKQDSFGRWLAQVSRSDGDGNLDATEWMKHWLAGWQQHQQKAQEETA